MNVGLPDDNPPLLIPLSHYLIISLGGTQAVGGTKFNLVANAYHEGDADAGVFKVHVLNKSTYVHIW